MDITGSGKQPGAGGPTAWDDSSWTDETLPMGLRKQLLDRELQKYVAKKHHARSAASLSEARADRQGATGHPQADTPSDGEHGT